MRGLVWSGLVLGLVLVGGEVARGCPLGYGEVGVSSVYAGVNVLASPLVMVQEEVGLLGSGACGVEVSSRAAVRVRAVPRLRVLERVVPRSAVRVRVLVR